MRRDIERGFMGFSSRHRRSKASGDWHNLNLGPDHDMDWGPDYGARLSGSTPYDRGFSHMGRRGMHDDAGYDRDHDRSSTVGRYDRRSERDDWRSEDRYRDDRDWRDAGRYEPRDEGRYDRRYDRDDWRGDRDDDRDDWRSDRGAYGDHGREANRPYESNYGRGYDREFGESYERGYGRDYGRNAGAQAREGFTRPGNYDASFERGAYRGDYDRDNDRRDTWGSRGYDHDAIGRGRDYDRDFERRRGDFSTGEGRPYAGARGLLTGEGEDRGGLGPHAGRGPKGYSRSPEHIREDVCERLTHHGHLDATHVRIRVENEEVTLEGEVDSRTSKRLAEDLAETVRGVRDVHNRLRVNRDLHRDTGTALTPGKETTATQTDDATVASTAAAEPKPEQTLTGTRGATSRKAQPSASEGGTPNGKTD